MLTITDEKWVALAATLGVERAVLQAVAQVESGGSGFLPTTPPRPKILFEGHYFHRLTNGRFSATHPTLSFAKWTRQHYARTRLGEWARLEQAIALDRTAALQSASWGAFQIMGANHAQCGFSDVEGFVAAQRAGAEAQLEAFTRFISRRWYLQPLQARDWALFASRYNGPGYAANKYDQKLKAAYEALATRRASTGSAGVPSRQRPMGRPSVAAVPAAGQRQSRSFVRADALDLRDWIYRPRVTEAPTRTLVPPAWRSVSDQGRTNACTGFALATVIEYLLARAQRQEARGEVAAVSGHMLYDMARRYDEWTGNEAEDQGSSLRGALRGWFHHGAAALDLWPEHGMPAASLDAGDWWLDAVTRPLGAYFRLQTDTISDIHSALCEAGVLYASALTHAGWEALYRARPKKLPADVEQLPVIETRPGVADRGHAFAIVGYTPRGFIIHNSWGRVWGAGGFAILPYADWRQNAMDCWVAQLGVVTDEHRAVSASPTLRVDAESGQVQLSSNRQLAAHEIAPFVVNIAPDGALSSRGRFRTNEEDLDLIVSEHLPRARALWALAADEPVDVAIVFHDGLAGEEGALDRALHWVSVLYSQRIFPVVVLWETDAAGAVRSLLEAKVEEDEHTPKRPAPWRAVTPTALLAWHDERLEGRLRVPGRALWSEVKVDARRIATATHAGLAGLLQRIRAHTPSGERPRVRVHLVAHSAGGLVLTHVLPSVVASGLSLGTVSLVAPAVPVEEFADVAGAAVAASAVRVLVAHLTDAADRSDATCTPYGRSLLYLVSRVLERDANTPLLGLEMHLVPAMLQHEWGAQVTRVASPGGRTPKAMRFTTATTHGGLPEDPAVVQAIVEHIRG